MLARSEKLRVREAKRGIATTSGSSRLITAVSQRAKMRALAAAVAGQIRIAVQVIRRHVQHRRRTAVQRRGGLQLIAGQLQHVQLGAGSQKIQCRLAEVAARAHLEAGALRHVGEQHCHGALAVGAGDPDHRGLRGTGEQLDIAHDLKPEPPCRGEERIGEGDPRGCHHAHRLCEQARVEAP